jgi:hypothetical protein
LSKGRISPKWPEFCRPYPDDYVVSTSEWATIQAQPRSRTLRRFPLLIR